MSTTPEDNKPAAESPTPPTPSAADPTMTAQTAAKGGRGKLCKIAGGVVALLVAALVTLHFVNQGSERGRVYGEGRPLEEITQLRQEQQQFLTGQNPAGKTLEQAMAEALR
jgi:hypothetical protein